RADRPPASVALQAGVLAVAGPEGPEQKVVAIEQFSAQEVSDCDHPVTLPLGRPVLQRWLRGPSAVPPGAAVLRPRRASGCGRSRVRHTVGRSHCGPGMTV